MANSRPVKAGTFYVSDSFQDHVARHSVNPGVDYAVAYGTPVYAVVSGRIGIADANADGAGGRCVTLNGDGWGFDYLHLSRLNVRAGQYVLKGKLLGWSGASAFGSNFGVGAHLHFSARGTYSYHFQNHGNVDWEKIVKASVVVNPTAATKLDQERLNKWASYDNANKLAITSKRDAATIARIKQFQGLHGLKQDGIAGPSTDKRLSAPLPIVRRSDKILTAAKHAQRALNRHGYKLVVDGIFGPKSVNATKAFQRGKVDVTGNVGPTTWAIL